MESEHVYLMDELQEYEKYINIFILNNKSFHIIKTASFLIFLIEFLSFISISHNLVSKFILTTLFQTDLQLS